MVAVLEAELEHSRQKLNYYQAQQPASRSVSKWIEIYDLRVQKLTKQIEKLKAQTIAAELAAQKAAQRAHEEAARAAHDAQEADESRRMRPGLTRSKRGSTSRALPAAASSRAASSGSRASKASRPSAAQGKRRSR